VHRLLLVLGCLAAIACDSRTTPAPPVVNPPATGETITGSERIGWDQRAGDVVELAATSYVIYVDGVRTPLTEVTCGNSPTAAGFACSGRLPPMSAGAHTLQLASTVVDGSPFESDRSAALNVTVRPLTAGDLRPPAGAEQRAASMTAGPIVTSSGIRLHLETIAEGFDQPSDLAFMPDGRLLVAERGGTIRVVDRDPARTPGAAAAGEPALSLDEAGTTLLALAVDPQFTRTRFVFALYAVPARSGEPSFTIARFRESGGTLADRAVVLDGVRAGSPLPNGSLRFGPDGKLYAAFDDGGEARSRNDLAALNGKVVRLNPDGTTPRDQAAASPVYAEGYAAPAGFDWNLRTAPPTLWVADREGRLLRAVVADATRAGEKRGALQRAFALPRGSTPSAVAFYSNALIPSLAGSLLVASAEAGSLLAVSGRQLVTLLPDNTAAIHAVAVGLDGAIYFANASAIGRLVP
jgi:glucose/arabinose dehydrogenase